MRWSKLDQDVRRLKLVKRITESDTITSFHLTPADGKPLAPFKAGQHLPVTVRIPGHAAPSSRTYTLSGPDTDSHHYRLTIKKETTGLVSRHVHDALKTGDLIETRPPSGTFQLPDGNEPVVLISAGVGLTPMVSMLHSLARGTRPAWYLHAAANSDHHALQTEVASLIAENDHLHQQVFYSRPKPDDLIGRDFDIADG